MLESMANLTQKQTATKAEHNYFELLRKFDRAMLVTHAPSFGLHARPMAIAETTEDGSIWFITGADTGKVDELNKDTTVLAVMQSSSQWLSVSGNAEVQRDRAHIEKVWKDAYKVWFKSKDDPNIVLIRLNPIEAEYWDSSGVQGLKLALQFATAFVTGKELRGTDDVNQHAKVQL
jgi:general stress protein 26